MQYFVKILIILILIISITEVSKRNQLAGAILASLPITSLIAILWLHYENNSPEIIINLCKDIFWMVLPSLLFFWAFPELLKKNYSFASAFSLSVFITTSAYLLLMKIIQHYRPGS
jgi:hypothetical protein